MLAATSAQVGSIVETLLGPEDGAVLGDGIADYFLESSPCRARRRGRRLGRRRLCVRAAVRLRARRDQSAVVLPHGDDEFVPVAHGRWLAERTSRWMLRPGRMFTLRDLRPFAVPAPCYVGCGVALVCVGSEPPHVRTLTLTIRRINRAA